MGGNKNCFGRAKQQLNFILKCFCLNCFNLVILKFVAIEEFRVTKFVAIEEFWDKEIFFD